MNMQETRNKKLLQNSFVYEGKNAAWKSRTIVQSHGRTSACTTSNTSNMEWPAVIVRNATWVLTRWRSWGRWRAPSFQSLSAVVRSRWRSCRRAWRKLMRDSNANIAIAAHTATFLVNITLSSSFKKCYEKLTWALKVRARPAFSWSISDGIVPKEWLEWKVERGIKIASPCVVAIVARVCGAVRVD